MLGSLPKLRLAIQDQLKAIQTIHDGDSDTDMIQQQKTYLMEALSDTEHPLYSLSSR